MSAASYFRAEPRLAKMLREPGGVPVREALAAAEAKLEGMREQLLEAIDATIGEIDRFVGAWPASCEGLYGCATRIVDLCACPQERALGQAARSLCDILDQLDPASPQTLEAVLVHVKALGLLHRGDLGAPARDSVLSGLAAVRGKLLVPPPPPPSADLIENKLAPAATAADRDRGEQARR